MLKKLRALFDATGKEKSQNRRMAAKLSDMPFKYISEKDASGVETILARGGHINLTGENELCATSGIKTVFRLAVDEMKIWEFMSLNGCVITFVDLDTEKERTVTVYYDAHLS